MKSNRGSMIVIGTLGAVLITSLLGYALWPVAGDDAVAASRKPQTVAKEKPVKVESAKKAPASGKPQTKAASRRKPVLEFDEYEGFSDADRKLAEVLQAAMDSDKHDQIIKAAVKALESDNPELRQNAVEALGWCGKDALTELTGTLSDTNEDVRDCAINHWESALAEVDDPKVRYSTALSVFGTITKEDALDSISGQFGSAAQDYIDEVDDEEAQNARRVEVVQKLYDIIDGSEKICSEKAKEAYNDLTGYEWKGAAEAEKYLANPDDYEPPEDD